MAAPRGVSRSGPAGLRGPILLGGFENGFRGRVDDLLPLHGLIDPGPGPCGVAEAGVELVAEVVDDAAVLVVGLAAGPAGPLLDQDLPRPRAGHVQVLQLDRVDADGPGAGGDVVALAGL